MEKVLQRKKPEFWMVSATNLLMSWDGQAWKNFDRYQ